MAPDRNTGLLEIEYSGRLCLEPMALSRDVILFENTSHGNWWLADMADTGVPLRAAAVLAGRAGQLRRRCMERTGAASANSWFRFVSEPPLPRREAGWLGAGASAPPS